MSNTIKKCSEISTISNSVLDYPISSSNTARVSCRNSSNTNIYAHILKDAANLAIEETKVFTKAHSDNIAIKSEVQKNALNTASSIANSSNIFLGKEAEERTKRHESTINKLDSIEDTHQRVNAILKVHYNDNETSIIYGCISIVITGIICSTIKYIAGPRKIHYSLF